MTSTMPVQVVMLTDAQLDAELDAIEAEVCCPSYAAAAAVLCGCRGAAGEYFTRLLGEAQSRVDGAA